jgi:hypothetical protein
MALIGAGLLAAVFLLPDLLPDDSELVPAPPPEVEEVEEREPPEAPAPPEHAEAPIVEPSPVLPAEPLPPLEASDGWVRVEAAGVSTKPAYEKWLEVDDLVRRFVAAVDEIALGQSPRAHVPFLRPSGPFRATDREGSLVTAPRSFRRYDALAEVVASVDAGLCAELYRRAAPLIGEAFADLGYPDVAFDERLREALALLLATPVPTGREALVQPSVRFLYQDEALEGLDPAQKQLMRMGPENVRRVQKKLRELEQKKLRELEQALGPAA